MAINIEAILGQTGETKDEFAEAVGLSIEELDSYVSGIKKPTAEILGTIADYTGLTIEQLQRGTRSVVGINITVDNTWAPSREAKDDLCKYITEGLEQFSDKEIKSEVEKFKICLSNWKKPKISIAGQSDTGKSTLINAFIGAERMPAKYTPTTSIIVYIKHIKDRPSFIEDDVWIFGKKKGKLWDDSKLNDESYCRDFYITGGDYSLLKTYGTHQETDEIEKTAYSAVTFIDSKLLEDCDLIDLPGFAATDEDDELQNFSAKETMSDILIYMSRSNGFLQDRDLDYLTVCLDSLRPIETEENGIGKLENLFIIAAQAGTINGGNVRDLNEIIKIQCNKLCKLLGYTNEISNNCNYSLLPRRTAVTGLNYTIEDFRQRFFTYEMNMPRLCKKFVSAFSDLIEKLPLAIHKVFCEDLSNLAKTSEDKMRGRISEYTRMMNERENYIKLAKELREKEPGRVVEQGKKTDALMKKIDQLSDASVRDIQAFYDTYLCETKLVEEMEKVGTKNKKQDKQDFVSIVSRVMSEKIQSIMDEKTGEYTTALEEYLENYNATLNSYGESETTKVDFDTTNAFALGISALGVFGASAAWLATSFTATIAVLFPELASFGMFAAFGGVIAVGIGAVIALGIAIFKAVTWKSDLAKSIIKSYNKEGYMKKMTEKVKGYWSDTKIGVSAGVDKIEEDWKDKLAELEALGDEKKLEEIANKLAKSNSALDFFIKMPLPKNI